MPNRRWSEEDIEDLRDRVSTGQSVRVIASGINRSQEATRARMQALGLTTPRNFKNDRPRQMATQLMEQ